MNTKDQCDRGQTDPAHGWSSQPCRRQHEASVLGSAHRCLPTRLQWRCCGPALSKQWNEWLQAAARRVKYVPSLWRTLLAAT